MFHWTPFALLPLASVVIALSLGVQVWPRRRAPGVGAFELFLAGVGLWSAAHAVQLSASDLPTKLFWDQFEYLGASLTMAAWLAFALLYTLENQHFDRRLLALLAIEPLMTMVLVWTNNSHHLVWSGVTLGVQVPPITLEFSRATAYYVNLGYSYVLGGLGAAVLIRNLARGGLFRRQAAVLAGAALVPLLGNVVYQVGLTGGTDLTPSLLTVTGILAFWAIVRLQLLDVTPIARGVIFDGLHDGAIVLDRLGRVLDLNSAAERLTAQRLATAVGRPVLDLFPFLSSILDPMLLTNVGPADVMLGLGDGMRQYEVRVSPLRHRGAESGQLILLTDVTDRRHTEDALRASEEHFRSLIEHAPDVIVIVDHRGRLRYGSPSLERVLGQTPSELLGTDVCDLVHPDDVSGLRTALASAATGGGPCFAAGTRATHRDGSWRTFDCVVTTGRTRLVDDIILNMRDVTERKVAEDAAARLASHDDLTGLPNRRHLRDRLGQAIDAGQRHGFPFALLLLDLDRFKEVNDTFGHQAGDRLLQTVGSRLHEAVRADTVARLGGDEFAILLPGADASLAIEVAARVLGLLRIPIELEVSDVTIGASVGIALFPDDGQDAESLLGSADVAMYQAKRDQSGYAVHAARAHAESTVATESLALGFDQMTALHDTSTVVGYVRTMPPLMSRQDRRANHAAMLPKSG